MTALEKQIQVKDVLYYMCGYEQGCPDCRFFNPEDDTDGHFFCHIRDDKGYIPFNEDWNMNTAMIGRV